MNVPPRFLPSLLLAIASVATVPAQAAPATTTLANNTAGFVKVASDLGAADPSQSITVTLSLTSKDRAGLDKFVEDVRTPGTGSYHQFITHEEFTQRFGATTQSISAVKKFAAAHNLKVVSISSNNLSVALQGSVADVQKAFTVQIHNFKKNNQVLRSNLADPKIDSAVATSVTGAAIQDLKFNPDNVRALDPNGKPVKAIPLSTTPDGLFFAGNCFRSPQTVTASKGGVTASYVGNRYGSNITSGPPNLPPCGYDVADVWGGYNLKPMYAAGLGGQNETIVIVDAFGTKTIKNDANLFSEINGLPTLNSTNFKIIGTPTGSNASWATETTLDVEWAHAIAPHAKIVLEVAPTNSFQDLYNAEVDAVAHHRGVVISNSWSSFESLGSPGLRSVFDSLFKEAIALGINVDFSTGDYGDNVIQLGYADVGYPGELSVCNFDRWHQPRVDCLQDDEVPDRVGQQHHPSDRWLDRNSG